MGNESSQLEKHADIADRGGRVIGPPMSPTPSDDEQGRVFGPTMSPLPEENEADLAEPTPSKDRPRSPSKKRKKKQRESLDSALTLQAGVNDESHQSPKRKAKKRAKTNGTHDHLQEKETQEEVLNNGDTLHDDAPHTENVSKDDVAPMLLHSLLSDMKRKARLEAGIDDPNDPSNSDSPRFDAQPLLVSHAHGGTPPSAQHPTTNSILKYEPGLEEDADEQTIFPSSQLNWKGRLDMHSQASATEPMHFKRESSENSDGEELGATRFADATRNPMAEVIHEDEPPSQLSWCHKDGLEAANMPMIDNRTAPEGHSHRASPELLPSQIKIEHESDSGLDFDSESDSPSAARFERMSGSRSRSASKASTSQAVRLADQDLGLARPARPAPNRLSARETDDSSSDEAISPTNPSTPGSNTSIPARIDAADAPLQSGGLSRSSSRSQSRSARSRMSSKSDTGHEQSYFEPMEVDRPAESEKQSPSRKRAARTNLASKQAPQPTTDDNADVTDRDASVGGAEIERIREQPHRPESDDGMSSRDGRIMESWLSLPEDGSSPDQENQNLPAEDVIPAKNMETVGNNIKPGRSPRQPKSAQKRKAKASVVSEIEDQDSLAAPAPEVELVAEHDDTAETSPQKTTEKNTAPNNTEIRDDIIETGESANQPRLQPKGKKKRKLQRNISLSLTQLEDEDETMEGPSRLSALTQHSKAKDTMRGGSTEPSPSEIGASQEPTSAPKSRRTKRKRRTGNDTSEDEMENLLAAGPSKSGKRASKLGLNDDDEGKKRKRPQSNGEKATGAWTSQELGNLGRAVEEFRDANGMTQHEMNQMIHEVPNKTDSISQDFWNKAEVAVPGRTKRQIKERTRRLYHNFVGRGTWTEEQKQELHELLEQHGERPTYPWVEIAVMINRDPKDVRDYWRNHYLVHENQVKYSWSKEDEERLKEVVEEALNKIRIMRENNDQLRPSPRTTKFDEEALLDWQQISKAMGLTRSRQQCKWKWTDMREKGLAGDASIILPTQPRSSAGASTRAGHAVKLVNGISEELAGAREDYRGMGDEELFRLVDAIHASGARTDGRIKWSTLVDQDFRAKWKRPTLKLAWYRLRQTVPDHQYQDLEDNTQFLINYYHQHQILPRLADNQVDELAEEKLVRYAPGARVWKQLSDDPRALRERQRRSSSLSTHASNRPKPKVSTELLRIENGDEHEGPSGSSKSDDEDEDGQRRRRRRRASLEDVPIMIPKHLKGAAAKKALEAARARAKGSGKGKGKGKEPAKALRSASVAIDSDSE